MKNTDGSSRWPVRILKWTGLTIAGIIVLGVLALCGVTLWLTPGRLTRIVNEEASRELSADVRAVNVRYTLWSTFPHLCVEMDSLRVRSRNFDSVPAPVRKQLPDSADFLLSTAGIRGGINLLKLIGGQYWLRDVTADSLRVNLVAVNDTLNNYDIVPGSGRSKVPYFRIDGLRLGGVGDVSYRSLATDTRAGISLSGASLEPRGERDEYNLRLLGRISAESDGLAILHEFPVELNGDVHLRFRPFGISTTDYRINLGEVKGRMSMDVDLGGEMRLNNFNYRLDNVTLTDLMRILPPGNYPMLRNLRADVGLDATARLTTPYRFSSTALPSVRVDFRVSDGAVSYLFSDSERCTLSNIGLNGHFVFDGRNPSASYVDIPDMHVEGPGVDLDMNARVTGLTEVPVVDACVRVRGDLGELSRGVAVLRPYGLRGDIDVDAGVRFRMEGKTLYGTLLDVRARSGNLGMNYGGCRVDAAGLDISTSERYADALSRDAVLHYVPLSLDISADMARVSDTGGRAEYGINSLKARGTLSRQGRGRVIRSMDIGITGAGFDMRSEGTHISLGNLDMRLAASRLSAPQKTAPFAAPAKWNADARTLGFAAHTPEYIQVTVPDALRQLMEKWQGRLDVRIESGEAKVSGFPSVNRMRGLDLTATFDSVVVRRVSLSSGDTRGDLSASVSNLRQFLGTPGPSPLYVNLDVALDTVQINQLARAYTDGHPNSAIARGDKEAMAEGNDSTAILLPRNMVADIRATAMQTRYINLHLYDLMTRVRLADGCAEVDTLHISSDFGQAALNLHYDTSDLQDMNMKAHLDIDSVNVVNFFANFRKLLLMMPEMKNLSGMLSADVSGSLDIFPSMYLNVPSLRAEAIVEGRDLKVRQNKFIRQVTRMLMIRDKSDLSIRDMRVHAGVHSNLLEVFPFTFEMCSYKLHLMGLNNFNGDMYYHIGVDDWPLRLPFGINIKGHYHHPVLRFGGKEWHDDNGAGITAGVMDYDRVNVVRMARRYMGEFVHTAATYMGN